MRQLTATFYLVLRESERSFPKLVARIATRKPKLDVGEVVVELNVNVPSALFDRPTLRASVQVPAGQAPEVITADVQDNIARTLSEQLGVHVTITADPPTTTET